MVREGMQFLNAHQYDKRKRNHQSSVFSQGHFDLLGERFFWHGSFFIKRSYKSRGDCDLLPFFQ